MPCVTLIMISLQRNWLYIRMRLLVLVQSQPAIWGKQVLKLSSFGGPDRQQVLLAFRTAYVPYGDESRP